MMAPINTKSPDYNRDSLGFAPVRRRSSCILHLHSKHYFALRGKNLKEIKRLDINISEMAEHHKVFSNASKVIPEFVSLSKLKIKNKKLRSRTEAIVLHYLYYAQSLEYATGHTSVICHYDYSYNETHNQHIFLQDKIKKATKAELFITQMVS